MKNLVKSTAAENQPVSDTSAVEALSATWIKPWQQLFKQVFMPHQIPSEYNKYVPGFEPPANLDRAVHGQIAKFSMGISPASLALAWADWAVHLAVSPAKMNRLVEKTMRKSLRLVNYVPLAFTSETPVSCIDGLPQDKRFRGQDWQRWPFNLYSQAFLLQQQWWHNATTGIEGVSQHSENVVSFMARQILDTVSPVNFPLTNPVVLNASMKEQGMNFMRGWNNFKQDYEHSLRGLPPVGAEQFKPGQQVAITPGKVVYRNHLIELIQYTPTTANVNAEPLLIVPAWIMKYYILDLSPENSMVRYLVSQGHTVFMISWHNPDEADRDLGMDDYMQLGILESLKAIQTIVPDKKIHTLGYCLGGTLLAISAAYLGAEKESPIQTMTLLAAQTDFSEAGELMLFIDQSQVSFLEDMMWEKGYLDTKMMAGAFQLLRSNDLIWSPMVQQYLLGNRQPLNDLMAWNADATRMPYRMHSDYLRQLFLNNDLFEERYQIAGKKIALSDIRMPVFIVATENDHVAPWRSVYKLKRVAQGEVNFLLTSGGHNAGIVSEPGHPRRYFRCDDGGRDSYVDPDKWLTLNTPQSGSWWPVLSDWLTKHSTARIKSPTVGSQAFPVLADAPGDYIYET